MNKNPKLQAKQLSICLSPVTYESLKKLSAQQHKPLAVIVRNFVEKGMSVEGFTVEEENIRKFIREELKAVQDKELDRLIRLTLKATISSSTMMYASTAVLADIYADETNLENIIARAHKQAHAYMKMKEQSFEKHIEEARELIAAAKKITEFDDM